MAASLLSAVTVSSNAVIPIALALVFVPHVAKVSTVVSAKQIKGYNFSPRKGVEAAIHNLEKKGDEASARMIERCHSCHSNSWEAFMIVMASFLLAKLNGVPESQLSGLATAWVGSRLLYTWLFITGSQKWKTTTRSLVWVVGVGICSYVMYLACNQEA